MTRAIGKMKTVEMIKVGWKDAVKMVDQEGYRLQRITGKGAELLSPPGWASGGRGSFRTGGEAYFYMDSRSLAIYDRLEHAKNLASARAIVSNVKSIQGILRHKRAA